MISPETNAWIDDFKVKWYSLEALSYGPELIEAEHGLFLSLLEKLASKAVKNSHEDDKYYLILLVREVAGTRLTREMKRRPKPLSSNESE